MTRHRTVPGERQKGHYVGWREAAEIHPLGFLMQMKHRAQRSWRGSKNPDWKVRVCSICYSSSLFINAALRQAESQLVKRYLPDRPKVWIPSPLAGSDVCRGLATVHLQFQVKMQLTLLCGWGISVTLVNQMALGLHHSAHFPTVGSSAH